MQNRQTEWKEQFDFTEFMDAYGDAEFLFHDWIYPNSFGDFKDKEVCEFGSGPGIQTELIAKNAKIVYAIDLNAIETTRERNKKSNNIKYVEGDIAYVDLGKKFDITYCVGVIQHTENPTKTFENIKKHLKKDGRMIIWCYSREGNFLISYLVEPIRRIFLNKLSRRNLVRVSKVITGLVYVPVYTIYCMKFLRFLPYYNYFINWRKMSFKRNAYNVFDKLNAPITNLISRNTAEQWMNEKEFYNIHISRYAGTSWRLSGNKIR